MFERDYWNWPGRARVVSSAGEGEGRELLGIDAEGARKRAAVETYVRHEEALRRTARRYSICADDADDALQRGLEILLTKAPGDDPRELIRWTQTVVKHEALAVRRERERILSGPAARAEPGREDWVASIPAECRGPGRAGRAARGDRPQPRGAADLEAAGAARAQPAGRGLLLRGDRRDHRLFAHEDQSFAGRGAGAVPQADRPQRGRRPLRGSAAAALRFLRRRSRGGGGGDAARAFARLRQLPGDAARLPSRARGGGGAGSGAAGLPLAVRARPRGAGRSRDPLRRSRWRLGASRRSPAPAAPAAPGWRRWRKWWRSAPPPRAAPPPASRPASSRPRWRSTASRSRHRRWSAGSTPSSPPNGATAASSTNRRRRLNPPRFRCPPPPRGIPRRRAPPNQSPRQNRPRPAARSNSRQNRNLFRFLRLPPNPGPPVPRPEARPGSSGRDPAARVLLGLAFLAAATAAVATAALQPVNLRVADGGDWHAENDFRLAWDRLAGDPPARATYLQIRDAGRQRRPSRGQAPLGRVDRARPRPRTPAASAPTSGSKTSRATSGPGQRHARLRRRPARGRCGYTGPSGWIAGDQAATVGLEPGRAPGPLSGIRGYAFSVDRGDGSNPCAGASRCAPVEIAVAGDARTFSPGTLPEGVNVVRVRRRLGLGNAVG